MNGDQFKDARLALGYKKRPELAAATRLGVEAIKAWEDGRVPVPGYAVTILELLAEVQGSQRKTRRRSAVEQPSRPTRT